MHTGTYPLLFKCTTYISDLRVAWSVWHSGNKDWFEEIFEICKVRVVLHYSPQSLPRNPSGRSRPVLNRDIRVIWLDLFLMKQGTKFGTNISLSLFPSQFLSISAKVFKTTQLVSMRNIWKFSNKPNKYPC